MNKTALSDKHVPVLDTFRGIAAMSVCLFHFVCTTTGLFHNKTLLRIFDKGQLGVHMFFIISGFVIPWSLYLSSYRIRKFFHFLLKRFIRLEPPYILSILIAIALLYVKQVFAGLGSPQPLPSASQVLLHFGYLVPFVKGAHWLNQVYWTLAIEFQYYLTIGLLFPLLFSEKFVLRLLFYALLLGTQFLTNSVFLPYWLPIFLIGIALFLSFSKRIGHLELAVVIIVCLGCVFFRIGTASGIVCAFTSFSIFFFHRAANRLSRFFGSISYSVYLVHPLIGASVVNYLSHTADTSIKKLAAVGAGVAVTLLSAWVMYILVERPSKRLSSSIKLKKE